MLLLDNYFFPVLNVQANPLYDPKDEEASRKVAVDIKGAFNISEDKLSCAAVLDITVRAPDDATQIPYNIDVTSVGSFSIPEGTEAEDLGQRAPLFAFSILYTSSREIILTLTSRGPWQRVMLPVHHFHIGDLSEESAEDQPKKKRVSTKSRAKQR